MMKTPMQQYKLMLNELNKKDFQPTIKTMLDELIKCCDSSILLEKQAIIEAHSNGVYLLREIMTDEEVKEWSEQYYKQKYNK